MPADLTPLWPGYADGGSRSLLELLRAKITATQDADDPTDERSTRDLAAAIESHEWLKAKLGARDHFPDVQAQARHIRVTSDAGSWRPV